MTNCNFCVILQSLITKGLANNVVCPDCNNVKFNYEVEVVIKKPTIENSFIPTRSKSEPKKLITQKHYNALYNKYHKEWGIDKTLIWLDKKFIII